MLKVLQFVAKNVTASNLTKNSPRLSRNLAVLTEKTAHNPDEPIQMKNPFQKDKVQCILCKHNIDPDYKNVKLLSQFQSPYTGRIYGRHITGLCKQKHEDVERAIRQAQNCGIMPSYHKSVEFLEDPKLFDPERPVRPHKY